MRKGKPITITLGELQGALDVRLQSGLYASASEVVRAGLRALVREEQVLDSVMRAKIAQTLQNPASDRPADDVFGRLRAYHEHRRHDDSANSATD